MEILTAMFIFAVLISLLFGSFEGVFSGADHLNTTSDLYETGNACLDRITTDLQALHVQLYPRYKPPDIDDDPEIYRIVGDSDSVGGNSMAGLRFASLAHLSLNQDYREGIAEIVYYAQETEDSGVILRRADNLFPYPEFEPRLTDPVMCEQILKFEILYYDDEGEEYDAWDSESDDYENSTPRAVSITLVLGSEEAPYAFTTQVALPMHRPKKIKR